MSLPRLPFAIWLLLAVLVGVEMILQGADAGLIGTPRWRSLAYGYGAFWPGILGDWQPNFDAQPAVMFLTYAFLHAGLGHLAGNGLTLWLLGGLVLDRATLAGFAIIWGLATLGGALGYWALATGPQPVVGASGALFGLAGALTLWQGHHLRAHGRSLWPVVQIVGGLALLNLVMWISAEGNLAWQTHLGGFLAGALVAQWISVKPPDRAG